MPGEANTGSWDSAAGRRWWSKLLPAGPRATHKPTPGNPGVVNIWAGLTAELGLRLAGAILAASAVFLAVLLLSGVSDVPASTVRATLVLTAGLTIGVSLMVAGFRGSPVWVKHVVPIAFFTLLYLTISAMGEAEPRLVLGYATVLVWVAFFMSPASLAVYSTGALSIFAVTWVRHSDDPLAGLPIMVATILLLTICGVTILAREHLDRVTKQADQLSGRDPLTGLANLRPLYEQTDLMIQKAERDKSALSVLMIELDEFKLVNDRYSRTTGDQTLKAVARALAGVVRRNELVARRGGAEFALVTETRDRDEIATLIERLSGEIAMARLTVCPDGPTAITVGVATCQEGDSVARLLARADRALQEARLGAGPGRVVDDEEL